MSTTVFSRTLDDWMEHWGDRLNPILVKETRQILKSKQFVVTFFLMLAASWFLCAMFVLRSGDALEYADSGPDFFQMYYLVLMFCLCVVVPVGVFRSMTSEFVAQTFETLVVTPLSPARIIFGKLESAAVQMAIYYSAVAPFLCFAYLLRGIGVVEIGLFLLMSFLVSLSLCMLALMLASLAKKSFWESLNLLLLLGAGLFVFFLAVAVVTAYRSGMDAVTLMGGLFCFGILFLYGSLLTIGIATAQLSPTGSGPYVRPVVPRIPDARRLANLPPSSFQQCDIARAVGTTHSTNSGSQSAENR